VDKRLIPAAQNDPEVVIYWQKMKADFWRYITEFAEGELKNMAAMKTNSNY